MTTFYDDGTGSGIRRLTESERLKLLADEEHENAHVDSYCYPPLVMQPEAEPTPSTAAGRLAGLVRSICARCEEDEVEELFV